MLSRVATQHLATPTGKHMLGRHTAGVFRGPTSWRTAAGCPVQRSDTCAGEELPRPSEFGQLYSLVYMRRSARKQNSHKECRKGR
jgi:hypothetical protein